MGNKFLDKLKKENERLKKDAETRGGTYEKVDWFKPEMGDNLVRLLPNPKDESDMPYVEMHVHYVPTKKNDGNTVNIPVRCLEDLEKECPLCNAYEKMAKKDKEKAKVLLKRRVFLYNVLNYKTQKVQPWAAGIQVHEQIIGWAADIGEEESNVFSSGAGRNWKLVKKKDPRKPGNLGIGYTIRPGSKDEAIPTKVAGLIATAGDLNALYAHDPKDIAKMKEFIGEPVDEMDLASEFEDEKEEEDMPEFKAPKAKAAAAAAVAKAKPTPPPAKKAAPPPVEEEEEEEDSDLGVDTGEDEDLEAELRELGV